MKSFAYLSLLSSIPVQVVAQIPQSALAILRSQPDLSITRSLVERDPILTDLWANQKGATFIAPTDSAFFTSNISRPPFSDLNLVRDVQLNAIAEGIWSAATFQARGRYLPTKLDKDNARDTNYGPIDILTSFRGGKAVTEYYAPGGVPTVRSYTGRDARLLRPDLRFAGGIVHVLASPIGDQQLIKNGTFIPPNYALGNASARGLLDTLNKTPDLTLLSITNDAWAGLVAAGTQDSKFLDILDEYTVKPPGLYYGDRFNGQPVKTSAGTTVTLSGWAQAALKVNGIPVAIPDIFFQNGVVHVLSQPLR